jgi:hypothetical protein
MAQNSYQQIDLNGDIILSWPFSFQGGAVVADINNVSTSQIQIPCYGATINNLNAIYNNGVSGVGATLTNNGAFAEFSIDGLTPVLGSRILVKNQTPLSNTNGIYTVTTVGDNFAIEWVLTRAVDYDTPLEIQKGDFILVTDGTSNANTKWVQTTNIVSVGISSPNFINRDNGWSITLPNATLATPGQNIQYNNIGLFPFQILANDGILIIADVLPGDIYYLYLNNNSTSNGSWNPVRLTDGSTGINSVSAPLSQPGGVIDFKLPASVFNLNNVNTTGFSVITATAPQTWATRELLGGTNINITDGDGVSTNPIINLDTAIDIGSITLTTGLSLSGDTISNSEDNDVQINTTGTGVVLINGVSINASGNLSGVATPKVYFTFTDTIVPLNNVIDIQDQSQVASITGSGGVYTINFSTTLASTNYGVFLGLGSTGGPSPFVSHAFWTLKTTNSVSIAVVDASGVLVQSLPNGITGMIMLSA